MADQPERDHEEGALGYQGFSLHWQAKYETDSKGLTKPSIKVDVYASFPDGLTDEEMEARYQLIGRASIQMEVLMKDGLFRTDKAIRRSVEMVKDFEAVRDSITKAGATKEGTDAPDS